MRFVEFMELPKACRGFDQNVNFIFLAQWEFELLIASWNSCINVIYLVYKLLVLLRCLCILGIQTSFICLVGQSYYNNPIEFGIIVKDVECIGCESCFFSVGMELM